jgi:hypothetical protein
MELQCTRQVSMLLLAAAATTTGSAIHNPSRHNPSFSSSLSTLLGAALE